ncbi:MAG: NRDE family protein [Verrucomicrobiota bacterium]
MCTVTWAQREEGYELFFNRDEQRTRPPAESPALRLIDGVEVLAPLDPPGGGSWLGVNRAGLTCGLLNFYDHAADNRVRQPISRGRLLMSFLAGESLAAVRTRIEAEVLESYRSFILLALEPGAPARAWTWNGQELVEQPAVPPITTSSFQTEAVVESRRAWYRKLTDPLEFHQSHQPEAGPFSVCMHREDAETVSFSHIVVTSETVTYRYFPVSPCRMRDHEPAVVEAARHAPGVNV